MKSTFTLFIRLICSLVILLSFQPGYALASPDNPLIRPAPFPRKPVPIVGSSYKSQPSLVSAKIRSSADPIRFTLTCNKQHIGIGEPIELTITAQLLDIPANLMFFLPGANGYSLKLLSPSGFQQTESELPELTGGELAYPTKTTVTYRVRGYFVSAADLTCFRLLRGSRQATSQSLFETKATLCLTTEPEPLSLSSPRARTGSTKQSSDPAPQLHVANPLVSPAGNRANLTTDAATGCTSFDEVCSGNSQEVRTITINVATAGSYPLTISYRSPEGNVDGILRVNNTSQSTLRFGQTSTYTTLTTAPVPLRAGDNTIGLSSGAGGGYLCFNQICVAAGGGVRPRRLPA